MLFRKTATKTQWLLIGIGVSAVAAAAAASAPWGAIYFDTANGRVGINVTTPTTALDVDGITNFRSSVTVNGTLRVLNGSQGVGKVLMSDGSGNGSWSSVVSTKTIDFYVSSGGACGSAPGGWGELSCSAGGGTAPRSLGTLYWLYPWETPSGTVQTIYSDWDNNYVNVYSYCYAGAAGQAAYNDNCTCSGDAGAGCNRPACPSGYNTDNSYIASNNYGACYWAPGLVANYVDRCRTTCKKTIGYSYVGSAF